MMCVQNGTSNVIFKASPILPHPANFSDYLIRFNRFVCSTRIIYFASFFTLVINHQIIFMKYIEK